MQPNPDTGAMASIDLPRILTALGCTRFRMLAGVISLACLYLTWSSFALGGRSKFNLVGKEWCGSESAWRPPVKCQGDDHWASRDLEAALPEFAALFSKRPRKDNTAGMNANHAFSLWFTVHKLKPKYIIENGVWRGQSSWFLRQAAGDEAFIFSLEPSGPLNPGYVRGVKQGTTFEDPNPRSMRMMGLDFKDFGDVSWARYIPDDERDSVFVMFDDHNDHLSRLRQMKANGFQHAWFDDNSYWNGEDCYSVNQMCAEVPPGSGPLRYLTFRNHNSAPGEAPDYYQVAINITRKEHEKNVEWMHKNVEVVFEFPAVYDGCDWDTAHQLLSAEGLARVGLPRIEDDEYYYRHFHPPYVKLYDPAGK